MHPTRRQERRAHTSASASVSAVGRLAPARLVEFVVVLLLLCACLGAHPAAARAASAGPGSLPGYGFAIREAVVAHGEAVLFSDLADPFGQLPPGVWESLAGTPVLRAPDREGRAESVSAGALRSALSRALGETARLCSVGGSLTVQRGGSVVTGKQLERAVVDYLTPRLGSLPGEVTIGDVNAPASVFLSEEYHHLSIDERAKLAPGRNTLRVSIEAGDGRPIRVLNVGASLDVWADVACASRPVNPGEPLTPEMVTFQRKNLAHSRGEAWNGVGGPWVVKRAVGQGEVIYLENLDMQPLIGRGDSVDLVWQGAHVRLTTRAEALRDGRFGDVILVRNLQTGREVEARIIDKGTVMVR